MYISGAEISTGDEVLQRSATLIRQAYADTDPDLKDALDRGEEPVINISVSFDGTWQKRGFTSLYGVGVCTDVLTGLVIDHHTMSKYCHQCRVQEAKQLTREEMQAWQAEHAPTCNQNHRLSSKSMEAEAAKVMWGRSEEKFKFRYMEMLSDGDSNAYKAVVDLDPYPGHQVTKLECVNHAHKRMGTALR